jgi:hypothetical protein
VGFDPIPSLSSVHDLRRIACSPVSSSDNSELSEYLTRVGRVHAIWLAALS